ncbi:hypothetical protein [Leifsonia xyli]|uniref:hypothetical protein n=1 Tax=Leifsonia xyli TaxID=1575 RepID=UPI003D67731C
MDVPVRGASLTRVKVRTSLTMRDRGRWLITTEDNEFTVDFRSGAVEQCDPNGYLVPLLDDPSLTVERVDWMQLGRTARLWMSNPSLGSRSPRHSLETTGRVLSIVSDNQTRSQLRRQRLPTVALGSAYSPETMCDLLDVGPEQLRLTVANGQALQVVGAHGETAFPAFQVTDQQELLPGLGEVLGELADAVDDPGSRESRLGMAAVTKGRNIMSDDRGDETLEEFMKAAAAETGRRLDADEADPISAEDVRALLEDNHAGPHTNNDRPPAPPQETAPPPDTPDRLDNDDVNEHVAAVPVIPLLTEPLSSDTAPKSGRWEIVTEASRYHLDLDRELLRRVRGTVKPSDDVAFPSKLRDHDRGWIRLLRIVHLEVGEPAVFDIESLGGPEIAFTRRSTTYVVSFRQLADDEAFT